MQYTLSCINKLKNAEGYLPLDKKYSNSKISVRAL